MALDKKTSAKSQFFQPFFGGVNIGVLGGGGGVHLKLAQELAEDAKEDLCVGGLAVLPKVGGGAGELLHGPLLQRLQGLDGRVAVLQEVLHVPVKDRPIWTFFALFLCVVFFNPFLFLQLLMSELDILFLYPCCNFKANLMMICYTELSCLLKGRPPMFQNELYKQRYIICTIIIRKQHKPGDTSGYLNG